MSILFYSYNLEREKKFDEIIEKYSKDKFLFLDILFQEVLINKIYFIFYLFYYSIIYNTSSITINIL